MRWEMDQAQWVFGAPSARKACAAFLDYHLRNGIAERIACPALICDAAGDLFFAGQARQLFDHLTSPKTFLEFTADEGRRCPRPRRGTASRPSPDHQLAGRHPGYGTLDWGQSGSTQSVTTEKRERTYCRERRGQASRRRVRISVRHRSRHS